MHDIISYQPHYIKYYYSMQRDNNGIVMVNFFSNYINCTDPDEATIEQVAG